MMSFESSEQAAEWFEKAASQGDKDSESALLSLALKILRHNPWAATAQASASAMLRASVARGNPEAQYIAGVLSNDEDEGPREGFACGVVGWGLVS